MSRILDQLNFFDFFGYLLPGAVVLAAGLVLIGAVFPDLGIDLTGASLVQALGFLVLAYLVGHAVQTFAHWPQRWLCAAKWSGRQPSVALLEDDESTLTPAFRTALKEVVHRRYGLTDPTPDDVFAISYSYLIQHGIRRRAEAFLGLFALSRGMVVAAAAVALLLAAAGGVYFADDQAAKGWAALAGALSGAALALVFWTRAASFSLDFAQAVYRDFFVAAKGNETEE